MSVIRLQNISVSFESNVILRDVFFRLSKGDRIGLIGKNGTGKTTLLKLMLGRVEPTAGTVSVDQGLEIGYFSQFSELHGESTVLEVLHEVPAPIHAVEEALRAYTSRAALAVHREDRVGTLEVGKYADLVILNQDPFSIDKEKVGSTKADYTIVGGRVVFERE